MFIRRTDAFTLIEATLAMVLAGILAFGIAPLLLLSLDSYAMVTVRTRAINNSRQAMQRMEGELMRLTTADLLSIQPDQISFRDSQGLVTDYRLVNGAPAAIFRGADQLLANVNALTFTYTDLAGVPTQQIAAVRRIEIAFIAQVPPQSPLPLRVEVFPRGFVYTNYQ